MMARDKRRIEVGGQSIPLHLKESARAKRLILKIVAQRLELVVPQHTSESNINDFLTRSIPWIRARLDKLRVRPARYFILGEELELIHTHNRVDQSCSIYHKENKLYLDSPFAPVIKPEWVFDKYLRIEAEHYLPKRCRELARQFGHTVKKISVRAQKTRWGSCSIRGGISLNYKLYQFRQEIIDYIIFHELCHLKFIRHDSDFYELIKRVYPHYQRLDKELHHYSSHPYYNLTR